MQQLTEVVKRRLGQIFMIRLEAMKKRACKYQINLVTIITIINEKANLTYL